MEARSPVSSTILLPGRSDLVFGAARVVVFVDGDFWHGRFLDERIARADFKTNADYWISKLRKNAERDRQVNRVLAEQGWFVVRVWESGVKRDLEAVAELVASEVWNRRGREP